MYRNQIAGRSRTVRWSRKWEGLVHDSSKMRLSRNRKNTCRVFKAAEGRGKVISDWEVLDQDVEMRTGELGGQCQPTPGALLNYALVNKAVWGLSQSPTC